MVGVADWQTSRSLGRGGPKPMSLNSTVIQLDEGVLGALAVSNLVERIPIVEDVRGHAL